LWQQQLWPPPTTAATTTAATAAAAAAVAIAILAAFTVVPRRNLRLLNTALRWPCAFREMRPLHLLLRPTRIIMAVTSAAVG